MKGSRTEPESSKKREVKQRGRRKWEGGGNDQSRSSNRTEYFVNTVVVGVIRPPLIIAVLPSSLPSPSSPPLFLLVKSCLLSISCPGGPPAPLSGKPALSFVSPSPSAITAHPARPSHWLDPSSVLTRLHRPLRRGQNIQPILEVTTSSRGQDRPGVTRWFCDRGSIVAVACVCFLPLRSYIPLLEILMLI